MIASALRMMKLFGVATLILVVILGSIAGWIKLQEWRRSVFDSKYASFTPLIDELPELLKKAASDASAEANEREWIQALANPKIIAVTMESNRNDTFLQRREKTIDPIMNEFETNWIPNAVADVNLILLVRWREHAVGRFSDGKNAYQEFCDFELIDRHTGTSLFEGRGVGTSPSLRKKRSQLNRDTYGGYADSDVVRLVKDQLEQIAAETGR